MIHLVFVLLIVGITRNASIWKSPVLQRSPPGAGDAGGGGGREVALIALPAEAPRVAPAHTTAPVLPPPVPTPTVTPKPAPPPITSPPTDTVTTVVTGGAAAGTAGGSGGGSGGGAGPGTGPGTGPGSGGAGGRLGADSTIGVGRDPEPRQLILPPFDYPKSMRGLTIAVSFFVLADGRVDHVAFAPEVPDHGYAKKLEDVMRAYRFRPARSPAGLPVPGRTTVSVSF